MGKEIKDIKKIKSAADKVLEQYNVESIIDWLVKLDKRVSELEQVKTDSTKKR